MVNRIARSYFKTKHIMTKTDNQKNQYIPPECEIVVVKTEGIICASKDGYDPESF